MRSALLGNAAVPACRITRFLLVVSQGNQRFPLSNVVIGSGEPGWTSANRRVGIWAWPESGGMPSEGRLLLQLGGHGPSKGHFVAIDIDALGQGSITQDDFGLAPLYVATHGGFSFASNRPELIASGWHRMTGLEPGRDLVFGALLALKGYPMGDRTGYADIRCVPFMASLKVTPAGIRTVERSRPPWLPPERTDVLSKHALRAAIDEVEALLIADMRTAVAGQPTDVGRPTLQLTGGRDSRLNLALALRSDVAGDVDVITHGDQRTPDARIARVVADAAGVKHSLRRWSDAPVDPFGHVRNTSGALNLRELSEEPEVFRDTLVVSGLLGETFRSNFPTTKPLTTRGMVVRAFFEQSSLYLLTEHAWSDAFVEATQLLMQPLEQGSTPEDLYDAFYVQHRIRRWISVRPDAFVSAYFPLYCPRAVHLAFALGWQTRVGNDIHDGIIARAGHGLSRIEYADPKKPRGPWRPRFNYPEDGPPVLDRDALLGIARSWRDVPPRWQPSAHDAQRPHRETAKRIKLYHEIINAKHDNPAFQVIDKCRLCWAIDKLPRMPLHVAKQVYGAMTSVIWLGGLETTSPPVLRSPSAKPEIRRHVGDR